MDNLDVAALWVGIPACAISVGSLAVAVLARRDGKKIAQQAKIANDTAAGALAEAKKATDLGEEANQIARRANDLVRRALAASVDPVDYQWRFETDGEGFAVAILNDCAHAAVDVAVVVDVEGRSVLDFRKDEVAAFAKLPLDLSAPRREFLDKVLGQQERPTSSVGNVRGKSIRTGFRSDTISLRTRATITCVTPTGTPRRNVIESQVSYRRESGRLIRMDS